MRTVLIYGPRPVKRGGAGRMPGKGAALALWLALLALLALVCPDAQAQSQRHPWPPKPRVEAEPAPEPDPDTSESAAAPSWQAAILPGDRARLEALPAVRAELARRLPRLDLVDLDRTQLDGWLRGSATLRLRPQTLTGAWSCRLVRLTARGAYAGRTQTCTVEAETAEAPAPFALRREGGASSSSGWLFAQDGRAMVYLGHERARGRPAGDYAGLDAAAPHPAPAADDQVGWLEQPEPGLLLLWLPRPDEVHLVTLRRKPPGR